MQFYDSELSCYSYMGIRIMLKARDERQSPDENVTNAKCTRLVFAFTNRASDNDMCVDSRPRVDLESPQLPLLNVCDRTGLCSKRSDMRGMSNCFHLVNRIALPVNSSN